MNGIYRMRGIGKGGAIFNIQYSMFNVQVKMGGPGLDAAGYKNSPDAGGAASLP